MEVGSVKEPMKFRCRRGRPGRLFSGRRSSGLGLASTVKAPLADDIPARAGGFLVPNLLSCNAPPLDGELFMAFFPRDAYYGRLGTKTFSGFPHCFPAGR